MAYQGGKFRPSAEETNAARSLGQQTIATTTAAGPAGHKRDRRFVKVVNQSDHPYRPDRPETVQAKPHTLYAGFPVDVSSWYSGIWPQPTAGYYDDSPAANFDLSDPAESTHTQQATVRHLRTEPRPELWGVVLDDIPPDESGLAIVSGVALLWCDVRDPTHPFATCGSYGDGEARYDAADVDQASAHSSLIGEAKILGRQNQDQTSDAALGFQWVYVILANDGATIRKKEILPFRAIDNMLPDQSNGKYLDLNLQCTRWPDPDSDDPIADMQSGDLDVGPEIDIDGEPDATPHPSRVPNTTPIYFSDMEAGDIGFAEVDTYRNERTYYGPDAPERWTAQRITPIIVSKPRQILDIEFEDDYTFDGVSRRWPFKEDSDRYQGRFVVDYDENEITLPDEVGCMYVMFLSFVIEWENLTNWAEGGAGLAGGSTFFTQTGQQAAGLYGDTKQAFAAMGVYGVRGHATHETIYARIASAYHSPSTVATPATMLRGRLTIVQNGPSI